MPSFILRNPRFDRYVASRSIQPPNVLYKYRTAKQAIQILKEGRLFWASPRTFADLEDCKWNPFDPLLNDGFSALHQRDLRKALTGRVDWSGIKDRNLYGLLGKERLRLARVRPEQRAAEIQRTIDELAQSPAETVDYARRRLLSMIDRFRVLCLCAENASPVMWQRYGDCGRGCVLGFDVATLEKTWRVPAEPVRYVAALPQLVDPARWSRDLLFGGAGLSPEEVERIGREWTLSKLSLWSHENEWRFVGLADCGRESDPCYGSLQTRALVVVYFGHACTPENRGEIIRLAGTGVAFRKGSAV